MSDVTILRADRWVDVEAGEVRSPAVVVVDGNQIVAVNPTELPSPAPPRSTSGDVTLLPGLMDMELNMLIGGPGRPRRAARPDARGEGLARVPDAARRGELPHDAHGRLHDRAQPRPDGLHGRASCSTSTWPRRVDQGWFPGPRIFPAGHAITPTGGHLDPTMFQGLAPGIMPQSVEQGIANGVPEVRKAVRYQIKYGAKLIKISASGGVMSFSSAAGAQQYSDEELAAIVDEAHRNGLRVAAHAHGDAGIRACIRAGVDCIEHGSLATDDTVELMAETRDLPRRHHRPRRPHGRRPHPPDPAEEGGRDLPAGPPDVRQGPRRPASRSPAAPTRRPSRTARRPTSSSPWSTAA